MTFEKIIVITGHYGSGKTNLAVNLALKTRAEGKSVILADLDVVNPYFRTADFKELAEQNKITLLASDYANSNLDIPALSGALDGAISSDSTLIIDVGGDDAGAFALGRYAARIKQKPYTMLCAVSAYRYLTREPEDAAKLLADIEAASRMRATHIANCSNLGGETTARDVLNSLPYAEKVCELTKLPLMLTAADERLADELGEIRELFPVKIYVKTPWN